MGVDPKQAAGRAVEIYGLPRPVTDAANYDAAILSALVDIRDELRQLNASTSAAAPSPTPSSPPAALKPEPSAAPSSTRRKAPARRKGAK